MSALIRYCSPADALPIFALAISTEAKKSAVVCEVFASIK